MSCVFGEERRKNCHYLKIHLHSDFIFVCVWFNVLVSFKRFRSDTHGTHTHTHTRDAPAVLKHSGSSTCTRLLTRPYPSPMGDIFNLIKACQRYWFWHFQLWPSRLWAPWAVDLLICDEGALSAQDHMDEEPLCLPYGPALSVGDTDTWLLPRSCSPPATHN